MGTFINVGNEGFRRIRNSEYIDKSGLIAEVTQYTDNLLLVGINYDREKKTHECEIENFGHFKP